MRYDYDGFAQLKSPNYTYDANGNRIGGGRVTTAGNRLQSDGRFAYDYDPEGNLIRKTDSQTSAVTTYAWDHRNRLTAVRVNGSVIAQYQYDVFDRRIGIRTTAPDGQQSVEWLVYDGADIVASFDGEGRVTHRYLHGPATDMILADEQFAYPEGSGVTSRVVWTLSDNLGTVRDLVDTPGTRLNHYRYDAFGNVQADNQEVTTRYGFTGREYDAATGLHYYRARYYDSNTGRFLSEDAAQDGSNFYSYVHNSPTMATNPSGQVLVPAALAYFFPEQTAQVLDWVTAGYGSAVLTSPTFGAALDGTDRVFAGWSDALTFGTSTQLRGLLYGELATRNHEGWQFHAGQAIGMVHSLALGYGGAGGVGWAGRAAQGYTAAGTAWGVAHSSYKLGFDRDNFGFSDALGFIPLAGWSLRKAAGLVRADAPGMKAVTDFTETGSLGGKLYGEAKLAKLKAYLNRRGVTLKVGDEFLPPGKAGAFVHKGPGSPAILLKSNPTVRLVHHELVSCPS